MQRMKMRVATRYSHSIPKLVCPEGDDGLVISTKNLNKIVKIDKADMTISVESGVTLKQLIEESAKAGLALPYSPYWWGLTIGGLLSTGAHGSTLWGLGSAVHNYVTQLRLVTPAEPEEGYVKVRTLVDGDPNLNAAKVSIGVLGVISQVTLKLQPLFKRSITYEEKSDSDLEDQAISFGNQHEFADLTWFPSQQKVVYRIDDRVSSNESGNGVYDFIAFRSQAAPALAIIRTTEEAQEFNRDAAGKCASAKLTATTLKTAAYGLTNNDLLFTGYPVVGCQNRFQSSGACLDSLEDLTITACPWDSRIKGLFFYQTAFTIALSKAKNFIGDVKKLIALEPTAMCNVEMYNGLLIRYDKASSAYLGKQEDSIEFEMTYFRSNEPMTPRLNEDILEEVEQLAFFKYGGLPHWGKNRNVAFDGIINKYKNATEFFKVKNIYDPLGLFSNEWTDQILGLKSGVMIYKEGCALEGLCICSEDIHCAPENGYFCRPGRIYEDARVTLKLQPLFKRSITYVEKSDSDLEDQAISFGNQHEFADLTWFPSQQKVVYRIDDRVSSNESGNGVYDFIAFRSQAAPALAIIRTAEEAQEFNRDAAGKCASAKLTATTLKTSAYGLTNNDLLFTGYPVVGCQNRFQSSGACLDSLEDLTITACPWDSRIKGLFFYQTAFTIALSKAKNFIGDVKKLIALEPTAMCNVEMYNGLLIRYDKASSAYLGKQEDSIEFEMTYFRSNEPMTPRLNEDILEEVEQLAFFKYGGLPHWGKNRNVAFDGIINKYKNATEFFKVKNIYDPLGLFSNEWTDQILGLKSGVMIYKEGCALEGLCICSEDIHCAPENGYFCRPGRIYEDARVCTTINN